MRGVAAPKRSHPAAFLLPSRGGGIGWGAKNFLGNPHLKSPQPPFIKGGPGGISGGHVVRGKTYHLVAALPRHVYLCPTRFCFFFHLRESAKICVLLQLFPALIAEHRFLQGLRAALGADPLGLLHFGPAGHAEFGFGRKVFPALQALVDF